MPESNLLWLEQYLEPSTELIQRATKALLTYVDPSGLFLRDSEQTDRQLTTGALAVCARLEEMQEFIPYLEANGIGQAWESLRLAQESTVEQISFKKILTPKSLVDVFAPGKISCCARLARTDQDTFQYCSRAWLLCSARAAARPHHPADWLDVMRASSVTLKTTKPRGPLHKYIEDHPSTLKTLKVPDPIKSISFRDLSEASCQLARSALIERALAYLERQLALAPDHTGPYPRSHEFDPAGTCFALNLLLFTPRGAESESAQLISRLALHHRLVHRTVVNILRAISGDGSLPYGTPLYYDRRGSGAFVTSISAIAALARFLACLARAARKADYQEPVLSFFGQLFQREIWHDFLSLPARLTGQMRSHKNGKRSIDGWGTDRAPSPERTESWVTVEVLAFAVYTRELLHECVQMQVCYDYGARIPRSPIWPVDKDGADIRTRDGKGFLFDPRRGDPTGPISKLTKYSNDWRQKADGVSSILFYGPPGTSKTTIAEAYAHYRGWHYLPLSPGDFVRDGVERIEQLATEIFSALGHLRETVILLDEMDSLFIRRESLQPGSMINFVVPAMLPKLQSLSRRASKSRLLVVIVTNYYERLDAALVRPGRVDEHFLVSPYNRAARKQMLEAWRYKGKIEDGASMTALSTYSELEAYAKGIPVRKSITPSLYEARIKALKRDGGSWQRLASELLDVCHLSLESSGRKCKLQQTEPEDWGAYNSILPRVAEEWRAVLGELIEEHPTLKDLLKDLLKKLKNKAKQSRSNRKPSSPGSKTRMSKV